MTIRNLIKFLFNTLMIGALITGVLGFIIRWGEFQPYFSEQTLVLFFLRLFGSLV